MKIGLVFPPMNNFKGLAEAIWSAHSFSHDLITIIEPQWYDQVPLAKAWNNGALRAFSEGCDFALICNDDIMFAPETIDNMVVEYNKLRHSDNVIMVTPNNIRLQLAQPYDILNYHCPSDPFTYSEHPNFSCFLIAPEFFTLCGTFDENFWPAWYEDNDMHRRAQLLGYKLIMTTAAPQVHMGGVSTAMIENNPGSGQSQTYYVKKWGGLPSSHQVPDDLKEHFTHPYNDSALTPREWIQE